MVHYTASIITCQQQRLFDISFNTAIIVPRSGRTAVIHVMVLVVL